MAIRLNPYEAFRHCAFLDGVDVSHSCDEAIPGFDGLVVLFDRNADGSPIPCACGSGELKSYVHRGSVSVRTLSPK